MMSQQEPTHRPKSLLIRYQLGAALFVGIMTIVSGMHLQELAFDDDIRRIYRFDDPQWAEYDDFAANFGADDNTCVVLIEGQDLLTRENVELVRGLHNSLSELEGVRSVTSMFDARKKRRVRRLLLPLFPGPDASTERFEAATTAAVEHPLLAGHLLSPDGAATLVLVRFPRDAAVAEIAPLVDRVRQLVARSIDGSEMTAGLTGTPVLRLAILEAMQRDQLTFNLAGPLVGIVVAFVLFRRSAAVLIVICGPVLGILWTFGFMAMFGEQLNLFNCIVPALAFSIGFTDSVHLLYHIRGEIRTGASPPAAAVSALRTVGPACALTSLTTAIGFAALVTAHMPIVARSSLACAGSVSITFVSVIVLVPLLASTRLGNFLVVPGADERSGSAEKLHALADLVWRRRWLTAFVGILVTVCCVAVALRLEPMIRRADYIPIVGDARQTLHRCDELFAGTLPAYAVVEWPETVTIRSPDLLVVLGEVQQAITDEPSLRRPLSLLNVLESLPGTGDDLTERAPELRFVPAEALARILRNDLRQTVVVTHVGDVGTRISAKMFDRIEQRLATVQAAHPGFQIRLTGTSVIHARSGNLVVTDLFQSLLQASIVIFVVLAIALRSFMLGLVSLIPNAFPLAVTGAAMVWLGLPLHLSSVAVFCVLLGIAVDDTIHYLVCYRREKEEGQPTEDALWRTTVRVGRPIVTTTLILIFGFGIVMLSPIPAIRLFSALLCLGFLLALCGDLVVLPALLACTAGRIPTRRASE